MNEKITNLIQELAMGCGKENIGLSLSVVNSNGVTAIANVGKASLVTLGVLQQYDRAKKLFLNPLVIVKIVKLFEKKFDAEAPNNEDIPELSADNSEKMFAQLMRHLRGDLR